jgi:3,4-dehydroadipyl-CoA semialdehyde dehydrogenase
MLSLGSFLQDAWVRGSGATQVLLDPSTEETIAEVSTEGLDFAGALRFARETGGAALRSLTFKERGEIIANVSRVIHANRDALLDLAMKNGGNTRSDAKFDVDGAIGTLAFYGGLGKELGDQKVLLDGEQIKLTRSPRYVGQHVLVPRRGAAVLINAFNFPAWGLGEKAACAWLAGMPVVVKPATSTAVVTHRIVELLVEAKALPPGALSLVAGPPGNLLDTLEGEDVLSFTGGGSTAAQLRASQAIVAESVRINVEADSLNAAILGPDVEPGSETYQAFVRDVFRDMTQKTGQKCTAIRRVFVPEDKLDLVRDDLRARIEEVVVGNPGEDRVTMGPVATKTQARDVLAGIERLASEATRETGAGPLTPLGVPAGKGFFVPPTLFVQKDARGAKHVHDHEVFGPVQTLMPYASTEEAVALVRRGRGSLVSAVYSDDRAALATVVLGIASSQGRVVIGSAKIAEQAPGPGTVLPQNIHGGPGKAGGGEELGGLRGLGFYSQRVALQGDVPLIEALVGKPAAKAAPPGDPAAGTR